MDDADEVDARADGCGEALRELYAFLDGELTAGRRRAIEAHLEGCNGCIGVYDFEAELKLVIAERCHDEVPPSLRDRIAAALDQLDVEP